MKIRVFNDDVLFADEEIRTFSSGTSEELRRKALENPSGKIRICLHHAPDAALHEMLVALRRDVRYPPHRHLSKEESYFAVAGEAILRLFHDDGKPSAIVHLGSDGAAKELYARIPAGVYHCLEVKSDVFIFLETKLGPFSPNDNEVAPFHKE